MIAESALDIQHDDTKHPTNQDNSGQNGMHFIALFSRKDGVIDDDASYAYESTAHLKSGF